MIGFLGLFLIAWLLTQSLSLLMLNLGSRIAGNRFLLRLGKLALKQKLQALDRYWPLTRLRPAVERKDLTTCTVILSALIILKSVASLVFGIVMVFWLPPASLLVPSIVAVHDPNDSSLGPWVRRVAILQVTSHALAAALGFAIFVKGPYAGEPLGTVIGTNILLVASVGIASLAFAVAAGKAEASGLMQRGI